MLREKLASDITAAANIKLAKAAEKKPKPQASPQPKAPKSPKPQASPKAPKKPEASKPQASPKPQTPPKAVPQAPTQNPYISDMAKLLTNRVPVTDTRVAGGTATPYRQDSATYDMSATDLAPMLNPMTWLMHNLNNGNIRL